MSTIAVNRLHNLTGHRDSVYTLHQADQPHLFFSGSGDGMVVLWNLEKPEEGTLIARLTNSIYAIHRHPETDLLTIAHNYEGIHFIDWKNKKQDGSLHLTKAAIFDIQHVENTLFVADGEGTIIRVDLNTRAILGRTKSSEKSARTMAINPKTGELAVGYSDCCIRVFDVDSMTMKYEWNAHANSVFTLRYTPDGDL